MNLTIISGGQTGADQAGWRAAKRFGLATGGWMTKGFRTEDGPRPEFAEMYGAKETESDDYPIRTQANVDMADMTIWFGETSSPGYRATQKAARFKSACDGHGLFVVMERVLTMSRLMRKIEKHNVKIINIAGNRESSNPGIGERTEEILCDLFRYLGLKEVSK